VTRSAVAGAPLLLVPALGAVQGGFQPDTWVWAGTLAAWAAALGLVAARPGALGTAWRWPAIAVALLIWTLCSAIWSAEPQQSVLEARRMLVYAAFALALVVLARESTAWTLVRATHIAVTGLLVYALLRYLLQARVNYRFEGYLISQPLGYANAVGILAGMGMLLGLGILAEADTPAVRAFGAATVPPLALALVFSGSKASWLALGVGLAAGAALAPHPRRLVLVSALVAVPSAPLIWLGRYSHYADAVPARVGGATLVGAAAGASAVAAALAVVGRDEAVLGRERSRAAIAIVLVAAVIAVAFAGGSTEPRRSYFHVAWHEYLAHPLLGSGAGTFGRYWVVSGLPARWGGALDAHSLYLETLAELGPVGLLLLVAFLLYPLRRALASRHVPGVPAAGAAAVAFLVHAGVDWDWELPAVVLAGLACLAAVLLAEERAAVAVGRAGRALALAASVVLGLCSVAGTASTAVPSATQRAEAPASGASSSVS